jgi:hypothetical protein
MAEKLNGKVLAVSFALTALAMCLLGYVWHGILGQTSVMNTVYPGFWSDWTLMLWGLACVLFAAFVSGYVFAWTYNWALKKFK